MSRSRRMDVSPAYRADPEVEGIGDGRPKRGGAQARGRCPADRERKEVPAVRIAQGPLSGPGRIREFQRAAAGGPAEYRRAARAAAVADHELVCVARTITSLGARDIQDLDRRVGDLDQAAARREPDRAAVL